MIPIQCGYHSEVSQAVGQPAVVFVAINPSFIRSPWSMKAFRAWSWLVSEAHQKNHFQNF